MFPVQTKITRKGSGEVTRPFCLASAVLHSGRRHTGSPPLRMFRVGWERRMTDAGRMHSFTHAEAYASDAFWAWVTARRDIDAAITALESAGAALVALVDESDWQSDGVRALHELLGRVQDGTGSEIGGLQVRARELEAVVQG